MENLIEYMDNSLIPLEDKVKEYLHVEREIRLLEVELLSMQRSFQPAGEDQHEQAQPSASQHVLEEKMEQLLEKYEKLQQEVIGMLPEKNKYVELDLGYGPSQVGYFTIDHETHQPLQEPLLRVVH